MRENWLAEIYKNIKQSHNERLSQALILLSRKAANDPEVAEALRLLRPWATGQESEEEKTIQDQ